MERSGILGTRREAAFDDLCELARTVTGAPVALIGFVDRDRVRYKASAGVTLFELPRERSYCARIVAGAGLFECPDVTADPALPQWTVPGRGPARLVAGMPITDASGARIGTLCVVDHRPGPLEERSREGLIRVAGAVRDRVLLHRLRREHRSDRGTVRAMDAEIASQRSEIGKQRRLLEQTSRLARIGGWEYDVARRQLTWSPEIYRMLDVTAGFEPVFEEVAVFYREDARPAMIEHVRAALSRGRAFEAEAPVITATGRTRWARFVCEVEHERGRVTRLIGTIQDVTELRATEEKITFIATHDPMTRLSNRAVFHDRLAAALADPLIGARRVGVVLIDIDHFKTVNDTLGHHAGDALLVAVGARLRAVAGPKRLVARLGGDEFAILATYVADAAEMDALGDRLMRELGAPVVHGDDTIPVTVSIGIAVGGAGDGAEQLIQDADIALYEAKGGGRNRVVGFDRAMREEMELRQMVLRAIRQALERRELVLWYQPKVALRSGALEGFEALLRWRRPDGYVAGPSFFAAALEDPQISLMIGDFVIEEAVRRAAAWRAAGFAFGRIAVNTATSQFRRGDLDVRVAETLRRHGVPASALMVEVTENVLISGDADNVRRTLEALKALDVQIALDDFGTGYASLTHLKDFPVDLLKIDRSFVSTLATRRESHAIVRGITALAHDLDIAVIAEGIETAAQRDTLRRLGVNYGQGFLFARPMPAEAAEETWLAPLAAVAAGRPG
ncbi:hypothetical protein GCM10007904_17930 [Oharaeibacter diazotrophicus]|nr:hypothetical protein GCM10007904_17930 [Oharaeibacter diazotrophicus]